MKKLLLLVASLVLVFGLAACGEEKDTYEIAMITDSGTIDDESFNQGTWEGITEFCDDNDLTYKYYKPLEVSDDAYLDAIELAIEGGAKVVVTPGYLFETSVFAAQDLYPEVYFILIDGVPHDGNWGPDHVWNTADNTLPILFNEHESGFLAGYAAVMDGYRNLGFTGGMAVPAVVKFGIGYVAGAYYAADELDVTITFGDATYHYFGDFDPSDDHKNLVSAWYVSGTEIVFSAAGGAGASVMAAAADNTTTADPKMMIGVDIDQAGQSDTVLTSALKQLGNAVKQGLQTYLDDAWVGGAAVVKGAVNDGVALPMATSLFTSFTQADYDAIYADLVDGDVLVPADTTELAAFLLALTIDTSGAPTTAVIDNTTE
jgi:basic membrane protein A